MGETDPKPVTLAAAQTPTVNFVVQPALFYDDFQGYTTTSDLVVMSACESARGRVSRGEGVVGLSRAFLGAGAGSVVASLWSVSDESTAELMRVFYERMFGKKRSASRALQEARLALLERETFSHPFFWSPFIVTGTERSPW